jgi:hypothetical protein
MRKTTDEARPVKKTPEEWKATRHTDRIERMKERLDVFKEMEKRVENNPVLLERLKKYISHLNKRIKDYKNKIKGIK